MSAVGLLPQGLGSGERLAADMDALCAPGGDLAASAWLDAVALAGASALADGVEALADALGAPQVVAATRRRVAGHLGVHAAVVHELACLYGTPRAVPLGLGTDAPGLLVGLALERCAPAAGAWLRAHVRAGEALWCDVTLGHLVALLEGAGVVGAAFDEVARRRGAIASAALDPRVSDVLLGACAVRERRLAPLSARTLPRSPVLLGRLP